MNKLFSLLMFLTFFVSEGISQVQKSALISVYSNREISKGDFGNGISAAVEALADDSVFDLTQITETFYNKLKNEFIPKFDFSVIYGEEVWGVEGYSNLLEDSGTIFKMGDNSINKVEEYLPIMGAGLIKNKKAIELSFDLYEDVDAVMTAFLTFELDKKAELLGFGTAKVKARCYVRIFNSEGKKIFKLSESGDSDDKFKFAMGGSLFETSEIQNLVEQATKNLFKEMDSSFGKKIAKMNKKLKK